MNRPYPEKIVLMKIPFSQTLENRSLLSRLWLLLFFIFSGVIVGENACEALLVTYFGYGVLPKMYMINALLLFAAMPPVFLFIDRFERGLLLKRLIQGFVLFILTARILFFVSSPGIGNSHGFYAYTVLAVYAFSYLFKITLFVLFWTLANDIATTRQSKALFPVVASGGITGGMLASVAAKMALLFFPVHDLFFLWALFLLAAWPVLRAIRRDYFIHLQRSEYEKVFEGESLVSVSYLRSVAGERLVWIMGILYFLIFIILFCFDFQFSKTLNQRFPSPGQFASFRYKFYFAHSLCTIIVQWMLAGFLVRRLGIISTLASLPLFFAGAVLVWWMQDGTLGPSFWSVVAVQFFRQVLFECFFSPNYQVFFSSLRKEVRGRSKVFLEGVIKPLAIFFSGAMLYGVQGRGTILYASLFLASVLFGATLLWLRSQYLRSLLEGVIGEGSKREVVEKIREDAGENTLGLLNQCLKSKDDDLRRFAIAGLGQMATREAFLSLCSLFEKEEHALQEFIAKNMGHFHFEENRYFLLGLTEHSNFRIVANALFSLRQSPFRAEAEVVEKAKALFGHSEIRVNVEAALLLWQLSDLQLWTEIEERIHQWFDSDDPAVQVACIHLVGELANISWLPSIWKGLFSAHPSVWTKAVDVLGGFHFPEAWDVLADYLVKAPREREDRIIHALGKLPAPAWGHLQTKFLETDRRRTLFALMEALRRIALHEHIKIVDLREPVAKKLGALLAEEEEMLYREIYCTAQLKKRYGFRITELLEAAVQEKRKRLTLFLFDMASLLDRTGQLLRARAKFYDDDPLVRSQLVEMLDSTAIREATQPLVLLMESASLWDLADFAEKRWRLERRIGNSYIPHLLLSTNNWIRAVTLFTLSRLPAAQQDEARSFAEWADEKRRDPSPIVASCARECAEAMGGN